MRTTLGLSLLVGLVLAATSRGDERAEAKALVDKAMKAMGGEEKLAKAKAYTTRGKGTIFQPGEFAMTEETSWQPPGQYRADMEINADNGKLKLVYVFNGDKGWIKTGERTAEMPKEIRDGFTDYFYALRLGINPVELKAEGVKLSALGEVKIGERPAVGVQVARKAHKDVNLYFDKETGLPAKAEITTRNVFEDGEVLHEFLFSEFKEYDGIKVYTKLLWNKDGKKYMERELAEFKVVDKLDDGLFGKP
jgi:hypothetical protein